LFGKDCLEGLENLENLGEFDFAKFVTSTLYYLTAYTLTS